VYLGSSRVKRDLGDERGAFDAATESLRLYRAAAAADRSDRVVLRGLASAHAAVGMAEMRAGQLERALASFREGTVTLETLVAAEPRNVTWNRELMLAYGHIADVLGNPDLPNLGDRPGALRAYRQAAGVGKRLYEGDRSDQRAASDYGIVLLHLGDSLTTAGNVEEARLAYLESAAIAEPYVTLRNVSLVGVFIRANQRLALNAVARAHRADALSFAERALHAGEHGTANAPSVRGGPRGYSAMGLTYAALLRSPVRQPGDRQDALSWLRKAAEAWGAAQSDPAFTAVDQREMREVEDALARIERQ
jgi:eukaryotic-like serine/threonine-protein kinase